MSDEHGMVQTGTATGKDVTQDKEVITNLSYPDPVAIYEKYGYSGGLIGSLGKKLAVEAAEKWAHPRRVTSDLDNKLRISPFYDLLAFADQANLDHWVGKFDSFNEDRFNRSWNWPSFFFGPYRYFAKGMYVRGIIYLVPITIVSILLETMLFNNQVFYDLADFTATLSFSIFFGVMGSHDYYKFCLKYRENVSAMKKRRKIGVIIFIILIVLEILMVLMGVPGF